MPPTPLLTTIRHLLTTGHFTVHARPAPIPPTEVAALEEWLGEYYAAEARGYPARAPAFDAAAAGWAARVLYRAGQLLVYRARAGDELSEYFPPYALPHSPGAALSADLCLRFLPALLHELRDIDPDDELLPLLEQTLRQWPYSGLLAEPPTEDPDPARSQTDDCLSRLYVDRIIATKHTARAVDPAWRPLVRAALGNHAVTFWSELNPTDS